MFDDWKRVGEAPARYIESNVENGVGIVRMNRPDQRNALSAVMCREMDVVLDSWEEDPNVIAVVISGGEKYFSAGMDFEEYVAQPEADRYGHMEVFHTLYRRVLDYPKPTIAAIGGLTLAGGLDLAAHCDIRIASEQSKFALPQPKFGIHSHFSPLWRLVGLAEAKLLFFTGTSIDSTEAYRIGLIQRVVETGTVEATAIKLAGEMAGMGLEIIRRMKEVARRAPSMEPLSAVAYESAMYRDVVGLDASRDRVAAGLADLRRSATERATQQS